MKKFTITYDDGYNYNHFNCYAKNKRDAVKQLKDGIGSRVKVITVEEY